jgi:hypothetical protein
LRLYILCLDLSFDQRQVQFFWSRWYWYQYVGISINGSTQVYLVKWSILGVLLGTPINGHTHIIII